MPFRRSLTKRLFAGVCGGIAAFLRLNAWFVRLVFMVLTLAGSWYGILFYLVLWALLPPSTLASMPPVPAANAETPGTDDRTPSGTRRDRILFGVAIVTTGALMLIPALLPISQDALFLPVSALALGGAWMLRELL